MAEMQNTPNKYSGLFWAINETRMLASPENLSVQDREILSLINEKIIILRDLGCEGIQEKFKKFDQNNAITYLAELVVAEIFLNRGHRVILLGSECFPRASPDIFVQTQHGDLFVEVAYMSSSDPASILINNLREITEKYPYVINFSFAADVSLPHHNWNERNQQLEKLELSVKQFESELEHINLNSIPYHRTTQSFSFDIIEKMSSGMGYPAVLTSSCSTSLDYSFAYLTLRLRKKGMKRLTFPPDKQVIPYVVALVCDEPGINAGELGFLLYGSTAHYECYSMPKIPDGVRERQKNKRWLEILQKVSSDSSWVEIQSANEKGWGDLLSTTYLLPHDYCYVNEPGLYFTEDTMHQVSGVIFCRCTGNYSLFPNPFSIDNMKFSPFWENL